MTDYNPFMSRRWRLAHGRSLDLGPRGLLMAVINVTPDSFSDGGELADSSGAIAAARRLAADGAAIIDIGGESTRPDATAIDAETEQRRVLPVIAGLRDDEVILSVDTYRASTARAAIEAGAHVVNDVHGLQREPDIARVVADYGAGLVIMHTGRGREKRPDVIDDQRAFFETSLEIAARAGVSEHTIVLDPGFGFAKDAAENWQLMARFAELNTLGFPILAGTSRKRFLGAVTGREPSERDVATAATTALLRMAGAAVFRVHNVAFSRDALAVADAMLKVHEEPC